MAVSDFTDEVQVKVLRSHVKIPVIFLVPAAMLASLYCVVYFYVNSNLFRAELPDLLHRALGGAFGVQELVVEPSLAGAEVYGATIRREEDERPVIQASEAEASIEPGFLLVGRLVFDHGRAEGAHVRLQFDEDNNLNLLQALGLESDDEEPSDPEEARALPVTFRSVTAVDCSLDFVRPEFAFQVPDVDVRQARIDLQRYGLSMGVPRVDIPTIDFRFYNELFGFAESYGDWTFTVEDVAVDRWEWQDDGFEVGKLTLFAEGAQAEVEGRMDFPTRPDGDGGFEYQGRGNLSVPYWSPLAQYFVKDTAHFEVPSLEATVDGTLEVIDGRMRARADLVHAAGLELTDIVADATLRNEHILLEQAKADFYGGQIRADWGYLDMFDVSYGGGGRLEGIDPAGLLGAFGLEVPAVRGEMSGGFEAHGAVPMGAEFAVDEPYPLLEDARRNLLELEATTDWQLERSNRQWVPVGRGTIREGTELLVDYERLAVPEADVSVPGGRFAVEHFAVDYDEMAFRPPVAAPAVDIRADIADIGPWREGWGVEGVSGEFDGRIWANGPVSVPTAGLRANLEAPEVQIGGAKVEGTRGELALNVDRGELRVERFGFDSSAGEVSASGSLRFAEVFERQGETERRLLDDQPIDMTYRAEGVDMEVVDRALGGLLGASGELEVEGEAGGSVQQPTVGYRVSMPDGEVAWFPFRELQVDGEWSREAVRVEEFAAEIAGTGDVSANGRYGFGDGEYAFELGVDGLQLERTTYIAAIDESYRPRGELNVDLEGEGRPGTRAVSGDVEVRGVRIGAREMGDLALVANTVDNTLHVAGAALPVGTVSFEMPLVGRDRYRAKFGVEQLDFARVFPEVGDLSLVESLVATGRLEVDAAADLSDYVLSVNMADVRLKTPEETIRTKGPLRASFDSNHRVQIEEATVGSGGRFIDIRGGVLLDSYLTSLQIEGELDLELIDVLGRHLFADAMPEALVETSGAVDLSVNIGGPPSRPVPSGHMSIQQANFELRDFAGSLKLEEGRVEFTPESVVVPADQEIRGEFMGGLFNTSGELNIEDYRPTSARFRVGAHNLMYRIPETANMTFDTDVTLEADEITRPETWRVGGGVEILDALYFRDTSLFEEQLTGRVIGTFARRTQRFEAGVLEQYPWIGDIQFDLAIEARDGVVIENQIDRFTLDLELRLDLQLQRTLQDPRMAGEIDVVSGTVEFQGENFEVRTGSIEYTGDPGNPRIDITAGADIQNRCIESDQFQEVGPNFQMTGDFDDRRREIYHVLLNVQGRMEALDIQFESNPYADQRDILSLMLTGCTVDELTAASATQPTLEIALGPLLGRIEKQVRDVVELSEFTIMPGVERTQVRIGDQLSRRLQWRFQLDTGLSERGGGQRYQLEYQLSDRWSAEVSERSNPERENFLLDVKLKYRLPIY
jgi:hypothetical protein